MTLDISDKVILFLVALIIGFTLGVYFEDKINTEKYDKRFKRELIWRDLRE